MGDVITLDQIRDLIKSENLKPSDLFGSEALTADPAVKGFVGSEIKQAVAGEYAHRKRDEEGSLKLKKELEDKLKEKDGEVQKLKLEAAKAQIGPLLEKQKEVRKLDEKQLKFINLQLPKFTPTKVEDLEKELNAYLDAQIDEYKKTAEALGIEVKKEGDKKGAGGEPDETKDKLSPEDKYLDPKQNPWIPTA